jgi:hypothetical protein
MSRPDFLSRAKFATLLVMTVSLVVPATATADDTLTLRGFGTAVLDGDIASGEWAGAGRYDFEAKRSPDEGGGTAPASFYVMNDSRNIYLALKVTVTNIGGSAFSTVFNAPGQNPFAPGNDILFAGSTWFEDFHYYETSPNSWAWAPDVVDGGTRDGASASQTHSGFVAWEVSHPLNSADDLYDMSLTIPKHVTFFADFQHCLSTCVATFVPAAGFGQIVVVSGTHVPPETRITSGPRDGAQLREEKTFEFTGTDDVAPLDELSFECAIDGDEWSDCESPIGGVVADGWHTLRIRALDDMLNRDPTPAHRRWRLDTRSPSRPTIVRRGRLLLFSAKDRGTPAGRIRFRCAVDTKRFHACHSRLRVPARAHVIRFRAVDPAGNESDVKIVHLAA